MGERENVTESVQLWCCTGEPEGQGIAKATEQLSFRYSDLIMFYSLRNPTYAFDLPLSCHLVCVKGDNNMILWQEGLEPKCPFKHGATWSCILQ